MFHRFGWVLLLFVFLSCSMGACFPLLETGEVIKVVKAQKTAAPATVPLPIQLGPSVIAAPTVAVTLAAPDSPFGSLVVANPAFTPGDIGADGNTIKRFLTLKRLLATGLMTEDEYGARRTQNVGGLLPLSSSTPPAFGLERPVTPADQIEARLKALRTALEMRAMTAGEHAAERTMILDGILPSSPMARGVLQAPPTEVLAAATAAGRVERLLSAGVITSEEAKRERELIEAGLRGGVDAVAAAKAASQLLVSSSKGKKPNSKSTKHGGGRGKAASEHGPGPLVHLASFKTKAEADTGWREIADKYREYLGGLTPEIAPINLGVDLGTYFRVTVGPLKNAAAAKSLCAQLKASRQYCRIGTDNK